MQIPRQLLGKEKALFQPTRVIMEATIWETRTCATFDSSRLVGERTRTVASALASPQALLLFGIAKTWTRPGGGRDLLLLPRFLQVLLPSLIVTFQERWQGRKKEVGSDLVPQKSLISGGTHCCFIEAKLSQNLKLWFEPKKGGHIHQNVINPVSLTFISTILLSIPMPSWFKDKQS